MVFFHAAFGHWEIHTHTQRIRTTAQSERHTASQLHPLRPTAALFHKQHTTLQKHRCEHRTYKNRMCPSHRASASRTVGACRTLPLERDNLSTLAAAPEKRNSVAAAVAPKNSFGRAHTHTSMHVRTHKTQHSTNARTHTCVALPPERNRATVARTQSPDGKHTTQPSVSSRTRALILASYTHAHTIRQIRARSLSLTLTLLPCRLPLKHWCASAFETDFFSALACVGLHTSSSRFCSPFRFPLHGRYT